MCLSSLRFSESWNRSRVRAIVFELLGEVRRRASANFGRTHRIFEGVQTGRGAFSGRGVTANWGTLGDTAGVIAAGIWLSTHFFFRAAVSLSGSVSVSFACLRVW